MLPEPKPIIYIASPYTKGDPCINTHAQIAKFNELMDDGIVWPVIPLTSHFVHTCHPRSYKDWIDYDLGLLRAYDACFRIEARLDRMNYLETESSGADGEEANFTEQGKPIFYDKVDLYNWVNTIWTPPV